MIDTTKPDHKLVNNAVHVEADGVHATCICGWDSGGRFSSFVASALFQNHKEAHNMNESEGKTHILYEAAITEMAARAQRVADEVNAFISSPGMQSDPVRLAARARHLSIARTEIEKGVAILLRAADM